jgi:hypothetical protein
LIIFRSETTTQYTRRIHLINNELSLVVLKLQGVPESLRNTRKGAEKAKLD